MKLRHLNPFGLGQRLNHGWVRRFGSFREQERLGLVRRGTYAYGLLRAADIARYFGHRETTVCEFGVFTGAGLLNMIELAGKLTAETGVRFRIVGFDTGAGLPAPTGFKDHPEVWSAGDYPMGSIESLAAAIKGRAELVLGDIGNTIDKFLANLDPAAPLGFISVDVDIYSSAKNALRCLRGEPRLYTPAVGVYLDDVGHYFANRWCGELAAIEEFNAENALRKIDRDRTRRHRKHGWFEGMHVCHVLDHPARNAPDPARPEKIRTGGNLPPGVFD